MCVCILVLSIYRYYLYKSIEVVHSLHRSGLLFFPYPPNHKVVVTRTTHPSQGALKQPSWTSSQVFPWWSWSNEAQLSLIFFGGSMWLARQIQIQLPSMKRLRGPAMPISGSGVAQPWDTNLPNLPRVFGFHTGKTSRQVTQEQRAQRNAMQMHQLKTSHETRRQEVRRQFLYSAPGHCKSNDMQPM